MIVFKVHFWVFQNINKAAKLPLSLSFKTSAWAERTFLILQMLLVYYLILQDGLIKVEMHAGTEI